MELRRVLFVHNPARPAAVVAAERGLAWCRNEGIPVGHHVRGEAIPEGTDLVVAVGGDGTLLRAAALVYPREVPILAVNAGGLGFLAACDGAAIADALGEVAAGRARVERRRRLAAHGPGFALSALNDAAVVGDAERFTALDVEVDGEPVSAIEGDGLIVSTPTGSTAYALAAGGPVLSPSVSALLLVPLAPHRLGARPFVVSNEAGISIRLRRPARILLDGELVRDLAPGDVVRVTGAPAETLLVRLARTEPFFARLRDKLGFAG